MVCVCVCVYGIVPAPTRRRLSVAQCACMGACRRVPAVGAAEAASAAADAVSSTALAAELWRRGYVAEALQLAY